MDRGFGILITQYAETAFEGRDVGSESGEYQVGLFTCSVVGARGDEAAMPRFAMEVKWVFLARTGANPRRLALSVEELQVAKHQIS